MHRSFRSAQTEIIIVYRVPLFLAFQPYARHVYSIIVFKRTSKAPRRARRPNGAVCVVAGWRARPPGTMIMSSGKHNVPKSISPSLIYVSLCSCIGKHQSVPTAKRVIVFVRKTRVRLRRKFDLAHVSCFARPIVVYPLRKHTENVNISSNVLYRYC